MPTRIFFVVYHFFPAVPHNRLKETADRKIPMPEDEPEVIAALDEFLLISTYTYTYDPGHGRVKGENTSPYDVPAGSFHLHIHAAASRYDSGPPGRDFANRWKMNDLVVENTRFQDLNAALSAEFRALKGENALLTAWLRASKNRERALQRELVGKGAVLAVMTAHANEVIAAVEQLMIQIDENGDPGDRNGVDGGAVMLEATRLKTTQLWQDLTKCSKSREEC